MKLNQKFKLLNHYYVKRMLKDINWTLEIFVNEFFKIIKIVKYQRAKHLRFPIF